MLTIINSINRNLFEYVSVEPLQALKFISPSRKMATQLFINNQFNVTLYIYTLQTKHREITIKYESASLLSLLM